MNSEKKIYLKCNLCDKSHEYQYSDSEYNAIEVEWISPKQEFHLLTTTPIVDENYLVNLTSPLTLRMDNLFWAVYLNPYSSLNGIEKEQDLKDIRFCKCQINKIIELNDQQASIEIKILDIKKTDGLKTHHKPNIQWKTLMDDGDSFNRYGSTENFKSFSYIDVNVESDLGISAVVKKEENRTSQIVAINQWDFHLDEWILCKIPLNKEEEKKYGIQHGV